tara:strand:- start:78 stop:386 length:309 start_codon:yes stop_codon:yes gene_type:complete
MAGAYSALRGARGRGKIKGRVKKLENQMSTLMRDRNRNAAEESEPEFAVSEPGSLEAQSMSGDQLAQQGLMPLNAFSPGAVGAASSMFGNTIPGSFDKDMGI